MEQKKKEPNSQPVLSSYIGIQQPGRVPGNEEKLCRAPVRGRSTGRNDTGGNAPCTGKYHAWARLDGEFKKYRNIAALDRVIVASLIDRIYIYRDKRVEIKYNWQDEFRLLAGILAQGAVSKTGTDMEGRGVASAGSKDAERASGGYIVPLKNIINEVYGRDISRKTGAALAVKQRRGEFIGVWASYGYKKCADDPHRIEPDAETAPVVREIFHMRSQGMSYRKIARELNGRGIPAPSRCPCLKGDTKCARYADVVWQMNVVRQILLT